MTDALARAVVTGGAVVSPLGEPGAFLERALAGGPWPVVDPPARPGLAPVGRAAAFVPPFDASGRVSPAVARRLERVSEIARLAAVAAFQAADDARLPREAREEAGVFLGTCFGPSRYHLEYYEELRRGGLRAASPLLFAESVFNAASAHVSLLLGLRGPGITVVGGEEAGLSAVAAAFDRVRTGGARALLAGGVEQHTDLVQASCERAGLVGGRRGAFAEGAALLVLEEDGAARARGAKPWAGVLGAARARAGASGEVREATAARAVRAALGDARADDVDLVVAGAEARSFGRARILRPLAGLEGFAFGSAALAFVAAAAIRDGRARRALVVAASTPGAAVALVLGACPAILPKDGA